MGKKMLLTLTVLAIAGVTAFAASMDGIVLSQDGRTAKATKQSSSITQTASSDSGLVKIFDNIARGYPKGFYWSSEGYTIYGPTAVSGAPEYWQAAAFTPTTNHTVTRIKVAVGYAEGTNGLVLGLYADAGGVPGQAIKTWALSGLPNFGSCCTLETKNDKAGIPVTADTQYWIVLQTDNRTESNTFAAWNFNDTDQVDAIPTAYWCSDDQGGSCKTNDVWTAGESLPAPAFAVLGSN